jgi:hypothetical protein
MNIKTNPFTVVFTDEMYTSISVSLVKKEDELKLARLFELFLLEHDISFTSIERQSVDEIIVKERIYSEKYFIDKIAIDAAMNEVKKDLTIAEAEELLNAPINDGVYIPVSNDGILTANITPQNTTT